MENLNSPIATEQMKFTKIYPQKTLQAQVASLMNGIAHQETVKPILHNYFQKMEGEGMLLNLFPKARTSNY